MTAAVFVAVLLLWSGSTHSAGSAMALRCRQSTFALPPPLASSVSRLLQHHASGSQAGRGSSASSRAPHVVRPPLAFGLEVLAVRPVSPVHLCLSPHLRVLALRGGSREIRTPFARLRRSLTLALAKTRGSSGDESDEVDRVSGQEDEPRQVKQSRGATKGDLVDIDAKTGAEIRRRPRGRGRSLAGYILQDNGDWVRIVGEEDAEQSTLSPFFKTRTSAQVRHAADLTVSSASPADSAADATDNESGELDAGGDEAQEDTQKEAPMETDPLLLLDVPPVDESMWENLPWKWVVFSDLHVSRSSLPTCLAVLRAVHAEAEQRGAGVIFLGDFWHEKGILRTEALNAVLLELRQWRVPMLALPGAYSRTSRQIYRTYTHGIERGGGEGERFSCTCRHVYHLNRQP